MPAIKSWWSREFLGAFQDDLDEDLLTLIKSCLNQGSFEDLNIEPGEISAR